MNINRRDAILGTLGALATAAVPQPETKLPDWIRAPSSGGVVYGEFVDCSALRATKLVFGIGLTIYGSGAEACRTYGPFYDQKHIAMVGRIADILIARGEEVCFTTVVKEVPVK